MHHGCEVIKFNISLQKLSPVFFRFVIHRFVVFFLKHIHIFSYYLSALFNVVKIIFVKYDLKEMHFQCTILCLNKIRCHNVYKTV